MIKAKPSDLGWAAALPEHWDVVPLGYVAKMGTGHTPDRNKPEYWKDCNIPWVTTTDVTSRPDSLDPLVDTEQKISALGMTNSAAVLHPADTVMLSRTASVGYSVRIGQPMATTQAFVTWLPGPRLDSRYLLLVLRAMKQEWQRLAYGSTHLTIYMPDLDSIRIPLPPLEEQRRIADFLDAETARIDGIADLRRRQHSALEERRESYLRRAILSLEAPPTQIRRLGATVTTGPFGTQFSASDYEEGGIPMVNTAHIRNGVVTPDPRHAVSQKTATRLARHRLKAGDIIVARKRHLGRSALITNSQDGWLCGSDSIALSTTGEMLLPEFLACLLRSNYVRMQLLRNSLAATIPNLNESNLLELQVPAASIREQKSFVKLIDANEAKTAAVSSAMNRQVSLLTERRQALITAAVTGQHDVSTASGRGIGE